MRKPTGVAALTELGRVRLSRSFFLRDFLHSEIASVHGAARRARRSRSGDHGRPQAVRGAAGAVAGALGPRGDPLRLSLGRAQCLWQRDASREGRRGYTCASNEANAAGHIWDLRDADGLTGATACVVLPAFWNALHKPGDWRILARWIDAELPYSSLEFFPTYWAFNLSWDERPKRAITSYAEPKGRLAE